ncbi:SPOR domain-containing protein [Maricaulis sp.]|uniref:SPOR domain-containing protein n=1 Tax=Maricaulis sp. TaxID=1486257 RepID=UPI0025F2043B|nr:SPOR domain-containing protein [Maricaulis sp.]MDF1768645.1 SPOR domain-containing protein [Maricaulis sp.]
MKRLTVFLAAFAIAGCASTADPAGSTLATEPQVAVAPTRAAQLADAMSRELAHLARFDPDALERVEPELQALANAIVGLNAPGEMPDLPVTMSVEPGDLPPPPADMVDAPSLQHAVHLASYRRVETAQRGWTELRAAHPEILGSLDARLSEADIAGQGQYLRLKAGPFDTAGEARAVCQQLQASGAYCAAVDFSGRRMADRASTAGQ